MPYIKQPMSIPQGGLSYRPYPGIGVPFMPRNNRALQNPMSGMEPMYIPSGTVRYRPDRRSSLRPMMGMGDIDWSSCARTAPSVDGLTMECIDSSGNVTGSVPIASAPASTTSSSGGGFLSSVVGGLSSFFGSQAAAQNAAAQQAALLAQQNQGISPTTMIVIGGGALLLIAMMMKRSSSE